MKIIKLISFLVFLFCIPDYAHTENPNYNDNNWYYQPNDTNNQRSNPQQAPKYEQYSDVHNQHPQQYTAQNPNQYYQQDPNQYHPQNPNQYYQQDPNQYHPQNPNQYHPQNPNQYHPQNPNQYYQQDPNQYPPQSGRTEQNYGYGQSNNINDHQQYPHPQYAVPYGYGIHDQYNNSSFPHPQFYGGFDTVLSFQLFDIVRTSCIDLIQRTGSKERLAFFLNSQSDQIQRAAGDQGPKIVRQAQKLSSELFDYCEQNPNSIVGYALAKLLRGVIADSTSEYEQRQSSLTPSTPIDTNKPAESSRGVFDYNPNLKRRK